MTTLVATMSCQGVIFHHSRPDVAIKARLEESENFLIKVMIFELIFAVVCSSSERGREPFSESGKDFTGSLMHSWLWRIPHRGTIHRRYRDFIHLPTKTPRPSSRRTIVRFPRLMLIQLLLSSLSHPLI